MNTEVRTDKPMPAPIKLSEQELTLFREKGWILIREVCPTAEVEKYSDLIRDVTIAHNRETRPMEERDTYGKAFLQTMNLWRLDERVAEYTLNARFASLAAQLLGVERVRLYHDQSLFKEPGGGFTPWHQDGFYWPVDQSKTVTMWMPLVDVGADMGSMSFASRSNLDGIVSLKEGISDQSEAFFEGYILGKGFKVETSGAMRAGDATFHSGLTLHRAPGNSTNRVRAVMTVIYIADGEVVQEPKNANQENDLATWFPGLKPGDLIGSEINPAL